MNRNRTFCTTGLLLSLAMSSSALAQGENRRPAPLMPAPANMAPNSMKCFYRPAIINAYRGDIVLSEAPKGVIRALMQSIDQRFTHTGIAGDVDIRHDTMHGGDISYDWTLAIPERLEPAELRDGPPGVIKSSVSEAYDRGTKEPDFFLANGLILTGYYGAQGAAEKETQRWNAYSRLASMTGHYRLFAYTDVTWRNPFVKAANDGTMCSGAVHRANVEAGNPGWVTFDYSAAVRNGAAPALFSAVRNSVMDDTFSGLPRVVTTANDALGLLTFGLVGEFPLDGGTTRSELADRMGNQIVNCMAFNACGDTGRRWRNGVGTGRTISPDNLVTTAALHAAISVAYGVRNAFSYDTAKPIETYWHHYCCEWTEGRTKRSTCKFEYAK